ncbi:MAG: thioredoxin domain-containing protein [Chthonomonadales bacterium]|nr:thioredoxin domain-containing protein [Chthonomonadales bacterium]
MTVDAHTNRLADETSPYLLQHAHNPVDWYPWGEEALARARAEDRPILLSVGYSACHWCHVMERESFEDERIAALMNAHFVCVKVDREERPDIDQIYMNALQMMTGQGGWPMTVFLTPEGKPFYGGTYYPPEERLGRPGFPRILEAVAEAWATRRGEIEEQGSALVVEIGRAGALGGPPAPVTADLLARAFQGLTASFDRRMGGFGGAPKFPQPMILEFLLRHARRTHRDSPREMATLTLDRMSFGGVYDHLGGGFHRYATDAFWLVPHFEKMLYDNALLARVYLHAWQATGDAHYRSVAEETLNYVLREMTDPAGGFYSSQDADSEGEEGRYFVWSAEEVREVLGEEDAALFARCYDVTPRGNWEGKTILNLTAPPDAFARAEGIAPEELGERLEAMRARLLERRKRRVKPGRDEKVLVSWNGLMLAALAEAATALGRADYVAAATTNAEFVLGEMAAERPGPGGQILLRLRHSGRAADGKDASRAFRVAPAEGYAEDYAAYALGLLALHEASGEVRWLADAVRLADALLALFADPEGGFFQTAVDAEKLVQRPKESTDNAAPSGTSLAVEALLTLSAITGERERYEPAAAETLRRMAAAMERHPAAFGRLLCAADLFVGPVQELAVVGPPEAAGTAALLREARSGYRPNLVVARAAAEPPAEGAPALLAGRGMVGGVPTAYVCEGYVCRRPVTEPAALAEQLGG